MEKLDILFPETVAHIIKQYMYFRKIVELPGTLKGIKLINARIIRNNIITVERDKIFVNGVEFAEKPPKMIRYDFVLDEKSFGKIFKEISKDVKSFGKIYYANSQFAIGMATCFIEYVVDEIIVKNKYNKIVGKKYFGNIDNVKHEYDDVFSVEYISGKRYFAVK